MKLEFSELAKLEIEDARDYYNLQQDAYRSSVSSSLS